MLPVLVWSGVTAVLCSFFILVAAEPPLAPFTVEVDLRNFTKEEIYRIYHEDWDYSRIAQLWSSAELGQFPYACSIIKDDKHICSCVYAGRKTVLTTSSCLDAAKPIDHARVVFGAMNAHDLIGKYVSGIMAYRTSDEVPKEKGSWGTNQNLTCMKTEDPKYVEAAWLPNSTLTPPFGPDRYSDDGRERVTFVGYTAINNQSAEGLQHNSILTYTEDSNPLNDLHFLNGMNGISYNRAPQYGQHFQFCRHNEGGPVVRHDGMVVGVVTLNRDCHHSLALGHSIRLSAYYDFIQDCQNLFQNDI